MTDFRVCLVCSSLGLPCGISNYTDDLAKALDKNGAEILLTNNIKNFRSIEAFKPDLVNIQFEYSLYHIHELNHFLNRLRRMKITSAITMHGWSDWSVEDNDIIEHKIDKIIVNNLRLKRRLIERGNSPDKIRIIPMGFRNFKLEDRDKVRERLRIDKDRKVVGLYGFFETWKGFNTGVKATGILQKEYSDISLLVRSFSKGYEMAKNAEKTFDTVVKEEGIDVIEVGGRGMYLPLNKIASILHACDVLLYPYQELFTYSSSAAIRDGIASLTPIVASDISFFEDIPNNCLLKVRTNNPRDIAATISKIFENKDLREQMVLNQKELVERYSWNNIGKIYMDELQNISDKYG